MTTNLNLTSVSTELAPSKTPPTLSTLQRCLKVIGWTTVALLTLVVGYVLYTNLFLTGLGQGQPAPNFTATNLEGRAMHLSDFSGRPVMLTFWSPDCFACRQELPTLQAIATKQNSDVVLLTIVSHMAAAQVKQFMREQKLTFPVIVDEAGGIPTAYKVTGVPFTYFINPNGTIKSTMIGAGPEGELSKTAKAFVSMCKIDEPCTVKK